MPLGVPGNSQLIAAGAGFAAGQLGLFSDKAVLLNPNKYEKIMIGDTALPFQPLVYYRQRKNTVFTEIAGSSTNAILSGASVKEDMGIGEAIIYIEGYLLSFDETPMQKLARKTGLGEPADLGYEKDWIDQLRDLRLLFEQEGALPITDKNERFLSLGVEHVVLVSLRINEFVGSDRRAYRLELQQDRAVEITKILPREEGAQ